MACWRFAPRAGLLAIVAFVGILAAAQPSRATDPIPWDAAAVRTLAERLQLEVEASVSATTVARPQATVSQQKSRDAAVTEIPELEADVDALVSRLAAGGGRDETQAYFDKIVQDMTEVMETAGDARPSQLLLDRWSKASATVRQLQRYYDDDSP